MKIEYLSPVGVLEVEQGALRELERRLPDSWIAFAAFQLVQRRAYAPLDLDLVVLTDNRILIVELKNWSGDIEYSNQQWFNKSVAHKSPVVVTNAKARVLKEVLKDKNASLKLPFIEAVIVLCHPQSRMIGFPSDERQFVLTLNEFCSCVAERVGPAVRFPDTPHQWNSRSANPLRDRKSYERFFSLDNPHVKQRRARLHGFQQNSTIPDYSHPRGIWEEFNAEHVEVRSSKALLRKWDFSKLNGGGTSAAEREAIGLRENRINETLRTQAPELHIDLLEPVGSAVPENVTTNFVEAYRLPDRVERLSNLLARRPDLSDADRLAVGQAILARFAKLHALGIAHRDITAKTLWIVEPARIILSSFAAARVPGGLSVGEHRIDLETGSIALPEDAEKNGTGKTQSALTRDVFLLGALIFELLEGTELERVNDVPLFDVKQDLTFEALRQWFAKCLDWDATTRYDSASDALDAFNAAVSRDWEPTVIEDDIAAFATDAGPMTLLPKETLRSAAGKSIYISEVDGIKVLVKCWPSLRYDVKHPTRNRRLLDFLQQARALRQSAFDAAPEVLDFGVGPYGLVLVTRWVEGVTLTEWLLTSPSAETRARLALSLLNAVRRLHAQGLSHGDLKEDNIVVVTSDGDDVTAMLLDVPDLSADGSNSVTLGVLPEYLEIASPQQRDLFTAAKLVLLLLPPEDYIASRREAQRASELRDTTPPIDLLAETIQSELNPPAQSFTAFTVTLRSRQQQAELTHELEGDNGAFPVGVVENAEARRSLTFFVTGLMRQIIIKYDPETQSIIDVYSKQVGHDAYIFNARRASFRIHATLKIEWGATPDASSLVETLYNRYLATVGDTETGLEDKVRSTAVRTTSADGIVGAWSTSELWDALAETDELNATRITLKNGAQKIPGKQDWLLPFELDEGVLDFGEDERIELIERGIDPQLGTERWYTVGLVAQDVGKDVMRVSPRSSKFSPTEDKTFYLRGTLERHASERRVAAMKRVLGKGALITRLPNYFDPSLAIQPVEYAIPEFRDLDRYDLNLQQRDALLNSLRFGPVSLLQGPPGTGKTKFISSFVHLVLSQGLGKNILLVSQSHEAVNNALEKVASFSAQALPFSIVRIGQPSMVSTALQRVHEDSRRQLYREAFAAEAKERVKAVGYSLGLPRAYVDNAVDVHSSLGLILQRIQILEGSAATDDAAAQENSVHIERLKGAFCEMAEARFQLEVSPDSDLEDSFAGYLAQLSAENGWPSPDKCHRLGQLVKLSAEFSDVLRNPRSNYTAFLARTASIVAGTCVGIGKHALGIIDHAYDWVIVDEAARASPMELVVAMQAGRRVLLVGDHLQLPPIYPMAVQEKMSQILGISKHDFRRINNFKRAFSSQYGTTVGRTLRLQYRMATSINRVVSKCFYGGELEVARKEPGVEYVGLPAYLQRQVVWIDTSDQGRDAHHAESGQDGALTNEVEANLVVAIVRHIAKSEAFLKAIRAKLKLGEVAIGIIAMYAAQRDLIRKKLDQADWAAPIRDLYTIGTVDSYQGKENRIIVMSVVRNDTSNSVGFLSESERINVGLSRAQDRLVVISSTAMWRTRKGLPLQRVLDEIDEMESLGEDAVVMLSGQVFEGGDNA
ncbi:DNA helicase [Burkholderia gladioli]|uniref:AAA domain-containing protein n=1 Tax=Burkholderia gladioli TaxID=28095 RepID=UPI000CDA0B56|nr:AAA domain-containing protein [Burkholderia gladioli]POS07419.1 DNA helicase [Burkholderia gladioli]